MNAAALLLLLAPTASFQATARAEATYSVAISREALRGYIDDIGLFARNMPGVVSVTPQGTDRYLYRTEKSLPLAGTMRTDFFIARHVAGDSLTVYRSVDDTAENYMDCRVLIAPAGPAETIISISLELRLRRAHAGDVHWLAPILGEGFISQRMSDDLEEMLAEFIERSNRELYANVGGSPAGGP